MLCVCVEEGNEELTNSTRKYNGHMFLSHIISKCHIQEDCPTDISQGLGEPS